MQIFNKKLFPDLQFQAAKSIFISPLFGASKSFLIKELFEKENQVVVLLSSTQFVLEMNVELSLLDLSEHLLPITELKTETLQEKLTELSKREKFILISTYELLTCSLPSKQVIQQNTTKITVGGSLTYGDLIEYFNLLNYNRDKFVEDPGDFSVRGAIIDFWSYSEKMPVRIEFDGDFIESIRFFDPESQRSIEKTIEVTIAGSLEQGDQSAASQIGAERNGNVAAVTGKDHQGDAVHCADQGRKQDGQGQHLPAKPGTECRQKLEIAVAHAFLAGDELE